MEYRVLGTLEVWNGDRQVDLGEGRQKRVLGALLLADGQVATLDNLIDCAWDGNPPSTALKQIRNTVSQLRNVLDGAAITPVSAGYRLDLGNGEVDAITFARRVEQARRETANQQISKAVKHYRTALALWRGDVLLGLPCPALQPQITSLNEQRLGALEDCAELELALGDHQSLTGELAEWVARYPLRERLAAHLMLAVYRSGRQADALAVYDRTRQALATELGLDPVPELQVLRQRILTNHPALRTVPGPRCDLPGDVSHFTGRAAELARLASDATASTALVISAIDGMAGIGKTTLAVHAAHRLAERYPDGQLFIDLHAHTPGQQPRGPASALERLLRAIGVPGEKIPQDLEERAALWRAQLADRRMLILLDNAADTAQVRPLLPGAARCLTLITSRHRLTSLEGAGLLSLDVLPVADARALFARVVGDERTAEEPEALDTILRLCGYLPLAIRIAAARLRHRPMWTLGHLAERLLDHQRRLAELRAEDRGISATFDLSYQHLEPEPQRCFRLLGVVPGPDVDAYAAAALTGLSHVDAEALLENLVDAHLLEQPTPGRYRFHDLLRAYANQLPDQTRDTARTRLLDFYLHAAGAAMDTLVPYEKHWRPRLAVPGSPVPPGLADRRAAAAWLDTEFPNLLAAAEHGPSHAQRLSAALWRYVHIRGNHDEGLVLHRFALAAARAAGDPVAEGHTLTYLGDNHWWLGQYREGVATHAQALALGTGNPTIEARALHGLGLGTWRLGEYQEAAGHFRETLRVATSSQDGNLVGYALRGLGIVHGRLGNHDQARDYFQQVLDLARSAGHQNLESRGLRGLGETCLGLGDNEAARDYFVQALRVANNTLSDKGSILHGLGIVLCRMGNHEQAEEHLRQALEIAGEVHNGVLETEVLNGLGECARLASDFQAALGFHHDALVLAAKLGERYELARAEEGILLASRDGQVGR